MPTPFGPQLIGETEKTLNAVLHRFLEGTGLTEPQWVTLRLADLLSGTIDAEGLVAAVVDRAHFPNADELVGQLRDRGLLEDGRLTTSGQGVVDRVQTAIATEAARIWNDLPADDVEATTRVLNEVLSRARNALT